MCVNRWSKLIQKPYENGDPRGLKLIKAILRPLMLRRTKETRDKEGRLDVFRCFSPFFFSLYICLSCA